MIYAILAAILIILVAIIIYTTLVRKKNDVENAFAFIDMMLRKR